VVVTGRRPERLEELNATYGVEALAANGEAVSRAELVIAAVKPQDIATLLDEISPAWTDGRTLLSVAAAIPTSALEARLPDGARVVRAMPNAPAMVHEGIAAICAGRHALESDVALAEEALGHLGQVVRVPEDAMDAVTALSGSGPAYFALLAEAMTEAGLLMGLGREVSTKLVVQTMLGSALLLRDEGMHPVELREAVTSPGGTTTRAIRELERAGVRAAFLNAINAAMERSKELARPLEPQ
jgi:pyrroline-5-carboxylate reductase